MPEACSAAYVFDSTMRTAVVNSLFGDGAAAIALIRRRAGTEGGPRTSPFASHIVTDALDAMRYDWDNTQGKFSFFLDPDIPYVVGLTRSASSTGCCGIRAARSEIRHWLVHSAARRSSTRSGSTSALPATTSGTPPVAA